MKLSIKEISQKIKAKEDEKLSKEKLELERKKLEKVDVNRPLEIPAKQRQTGLADAKPKLGLAHADEVAIVFAGESP